jgi:hypothetical protein
LYSDPRLCTDKEPEQAKATDEAGPSSRAQPSAEAPKASTEDAPKPSTKDAPSKVETPSKVNVVGLEKRPSEPTPSQKTASLTELSLAGATPSTSKGKAAQPRERLTRKAKTEISNPTTPSAGKRILLLEGTLYGSASLQEREGKWTAI